MSENITNNLTNTDELNLVPIIESEQDEQIVEGENSLFPTSKFTDVNTVQTIGVTKHVQTMLGGKRVKGSSICGITPNEEQEAIIEIAQMMNLDIRIHGNVLVILAGAGTGKTTVFRFLETVLNGNGQYTAFNAPLVSDARGKFKKCTVNTTHSLAFRAVGRFYTHRLNGKRITSREVARILDIQPISVVLKGLGEPDESGKPADKIKVIQPQFIAGQASMTVKKFCQSASDKIEFCHTRKIDGVDVEGEYENSNYIRNIILDVARTMWVDLVDKEGVLPFSHDVYVKIWQLGRGNDRPIIASDYILLDEAQDTAEVFLDILRQQKHAMVILVGDDNQQIYEWRGAVNALGAFKNAPRKLLSQSYRFGQVIADVANSILATLEEPTELVMKGFQSIPSRIDKIENPNCYLYRTNAGAIRRLMLCISEGKKPFLIGGSDDVVSWCKAAMDLQSGIGTQHPDLACFENWKEVEEYSKLDEGQDIRLMVKLINEFGAKEIQEAISNMPKKEELADMVICTAHKSKGREWDNVYLGPDFPTANKMTDSDRRLLYVAATRAKINLDISECPPLSGGYDKKHTIDGLEDSFIPGIFINYTIEMPTKEEQKEWLLNKSKSKTTTSSSTTTEEVKAPLSSPSYSPARKTITTIESDVGKEFTWTKFDGGWFIKGPSNTPIGTKVTVVRKDGSKSQSTIKSIRHKYNDNWIYGI